MNKRILKLFNEAGFHQPEMERLGIEDRFEKFAELIIRECADIGEHYADGNYEVPRKILARFGMDEDEE